MWKFILLLMFIPTLSYADFVASAGLVGGSFDTNNTSITTGDPIVSSPTLFGFRGEIEFGHPYLTFFAAYSFNTGSAKSQYYYTNPSDSSDTTQIADLKTNIFLNRISGGMRLRIIKLKSFRLYVGGGVEYGVLNLGFDKDDFKESNNNSSHNFEEKESQNLKGGFAEAGIELIFTANSGIRMQAQRSSFKTEKFETLKNQKMSSDFTTFSLSYIEYIETGNW